MELVTEPELYVPSINESGNYIDKIPSFSITQTQTKKQNGTNGINGTNITNGTSRGIRCPCGTRRDKVYESYSIFAAHIKTQGHQKWLSTLNLNKANYYAENETLKITIQNQRKIIGEMEKEIQNKNMTITLLTHQIVKYERNDEIVDNLIHFD